VFANTAKVVDVLDCITRFNDDELRKQVGQKQKRSSRSCMSSRSKAINADAVEEEEKGKDLHQS